MDPHQQEMEEFLIQYAIDETKHKVAAQVMRDLIIQAVKANHVKDPIAKKEIYSDIMTGITRSLAVTFFILSPNQDVWVQLLDNLKKMTLSETRALMIAHMKDQTDRRP